MIFLKVNRIFVTYFSDSIKQISIKYLYWSQEETLRLRTINTTSILNYVLYILTNSKYRRDFLT